MDKKVLIAIGAVVLAIVAGFVGYSQMPKMGGSSGISPDDPVMKDINWVKQKSKECGGDINKMSPDDKAKTMKILGRQYATMSVQRYSKEP